MARKVIWSYEATGDLEAIAEYIARDSEFSVPVRSPDLTGLKDRKKQRSIYGL
jgi:plasmid stabilization system protein ParE